MENTPQRMVDRAYHVLTRNGVMESKATQLAELYDLPHIVAVIRYLRPRAQRNLGAYISNFLEKGWSLPNRLKLKRPKLKKGEAEATRPTITSAMRLDCWRKIKQDYGNQLIEQCRRRFNVVPGSRGDQMLDEVKNGREPNEREISALISDANFWIFR